MTQFKQLIPQCLGRFRRHPDLITEVTGEAGAAHHEWFALKGIMRHTKGFQLIEVGAAEQSENGAGRGALNCQPDHSIGLILDRDIEP